MQQLKIHVYFAFILLLLSPSCFSQQSIDRALFHNNKVKETHAIFLSVDRFFRAYTQSNENYYHSDVSVFSSLFSSPYLVVAIVTFGIQWIFWVFASCLKTEKFYDLAGSLTFIYVVWHTVLLSDEFYLRNVIQAMLVTMWALRLGLFLFSRVLREGNDSRFDIARNNALVFLIFWTFQALWVYITLLPTMMLNFSQYRSPLYWVDYLGWSVWLIGFCLEVIADYQKSQFRRNPLNHKKFITSGLWSMCRYPNYLGEIMLWFGLFLCASSSMSGVQYASILSPMFVAFLLICVSGIRLQEAQAQQRWATDSAYLTYKKKTAKLIPWVW